MLSDKQSLFLCCFVIIGFVISGILKILDNFVIIALLCLAFLAVVINLFIASTADEDEADTQPKD